MSKSATNLNGIETDIFHLPYEIVFNMCGTEIQIARLTHLKKTKKPWKIANHAHLSWEFHYVLSGNAKIILSDKSFTVGEKQLYITPPLFLHSQISGSDSLEEICIECNISPVLSDDKPIKNNEIIDFLNNKKRIASNSYNMPRFIDELNYALNSHYNNESVSPLFLEGILSFLISHYIFASTTDIDRRKLSKNTVMPINQAVAIKNFIDANVCKNLTTQDIASEMYISARQIDRIFSKQYNMTPFQYLQQVRTNVAVDMIKGTALSYKEIAYTVGFSSYRKMIRSLYNSGYPSPSEIRFGQNNQA